MSDAAPLPDNAWLTYREATQRWGLQIRKDQAEYICKDASDAAIAAARAEGLREGMLKAADRLDLAEHDAEERDWRSGANAFAALAKAIRAAAEAKP